MHTAPPIQREPLAQYASAQMRVGHRGQRPLAAADSAAVLASSGIPRASGSDADVTK